MPEQTPMIWRNSTMECLYEEGSARQDAPCQVRIQGGELILSYESEAGHVIYRGTEEGDGHYRLTAPSVAGRGTLHRVPGDDLLEGSWTEAGYSGMWRIQLDE